MNTRNNGASVHEKVFRTRRVCLVKPVVGLLRSGLIFGVSLLIGLDRAP